MDNYRFSLEKYHGMKTKHICPSCGKRTFTLYVDEQGNIIDDSVGRCDRSDQCGMHFSPKQWFADHPTTEWKKAPDIIKAIQQPPKPFGVVPFHYIDKSVSPLSTFIQFLATLFDKATIDRLIGMYFLGATKDHSVIFPQIDNAGRCRTAKIQGYDVTTGKRVKGSNDFVHSRLKKRGALPNDFNLQMCLFGLHLIRNKEYENRTICIVESEKTAVIASGCLPQHLWMAAGALEWINASKLLPLKERKVLLYPDASKNGTAYERWQKIANEAKGSGIDVVVSDLLEKRCTDEQRAIGYDIGDLLVGELYQQKAMQKVCVSVLPKPITAENPAAEVNPVVTSMTAKNPVLSKLIEIFDCEITKTDTYEPQPDRPLTRGKLITLSVGLPDNNSFSKVEISKMLGISMIQVNELIEASAVYHISQNQKYCKQGGIPF